LLAASASAAFRSPSDRSGLPQHFNPAGTITSYPRAARTLTVARPISG
jgi:hypothetical protein